MGYAEFKAPKGVIKVELLLSGDIISSISFSGDFFVYPEESLEKLEESLEGVKVDKKELLVTVKKFYDSTGTKTPMLEPEHWVEAILRATRS